VSKDETRLKICLADLSPKLAGDYLTPFSDIAFSDASLQEVLDLVAESISVETETVQMPLPEPPEGLMGFIVFRASRTGPPKSVKMANVTREISRTVYLTALVGAASFAGTIATVISIMYALFAATSATIGYSDACVLYKAWKIAKIHDRNFVTTNEILALKDEISEEYSAPKCRSETEILDAIQNLIGLKAIARVDDQLHLKERIICFENGEIRN
jgi:hypothetical protein